MFVVMVASECAPAAQAGGLGQVIFGLSRELELRGHAVEIIMPKYDCVPAPTGSSVSPASTSANPS